MPSCSCVYLATAAIAMLCSLAAIPVKGLSVGAAELGHGAYKTFDYTCPVFYGPFFVRGKSEKYCSREGSFDLNFEVPSRESACKGSTCFHTLVNDSALFNALYIPKGVRNYMASITSDKSAVDMYLYTPVAERYLVHTEAPVLQVSYKGLVIRYSRHEGGAHEQKNSIGIVGVTPEKLLVQISNRDADAARIKMQYSYDTVCGPIAFDACTKAPTPHPTYPTPHPTPHPTLPTPRPTPLPTQRPTQRPTPYPTPHPTPAPTPHPTPDPTSRPTAGPTPGPTPRPTPHPTTRPTPATPRPTPHPTPRPTPSTPRPTPGPTPRPTPHPTTRPTPATPRPTSHPTTRPTVATPRPTPHPTPRPTPRPNSSAALESTKKVAALANATSAPSPPTPHSTPHLTLPMSSPVPRPTPRRTTRPTPRMKHLMPRLRRTPRRTPRPTLRRTPRPTAQSRKKLLAVETPAAPTHPPALHPTPSPAQTKTPKPSAKPTAELKLEPTPEPTVGQALNGLAALPWAILLFISVCICLCVVFCRRKDDPGRASTLQLAQVLEDQPLLDSQYGRQGITQEEAKRQAQKNRLGEEVRTLQVTVDMFNSSEPLHLDALFFASNSDELERPDLWDKEVKLLSDALNVCPQVALVVSIYTDGKNPMRKLDANVDEILEDLLNKRAQAIKKKLHAEGVPDDRVKIGAPKYNENVRNQRRSGQSPSHVDAWVVLDPMSLGMAQGKQNEAEKRRNKLLAMKQDFLEMKSLHVDCEFNINQSTFRDKAQLRSQLSLVTGLMSEMPTMSLAVTLTTTVPEERKKAVAEVMEARRQKILELFTNDCEPILPVKRIRMTEPKWGQGRHVLELVFEEEYGLV